MPRRGRRRRRGRGRRCRWCRTRRRPAPLRRSRPAGRASPPRPGRRPRPRRPGCRPPDGPSRRPVRRRRGARGPARRAVRTGGCPCRCPSAPPRRPPRRGGPAPVRAAPWRRPAVTGSQRQAEGTHPEPCATGCEVSRQLGESREADGPPVGSDGGTVHSRPADDADTPRGRRARSGDGERVVAHDRVRRSMPALRSPAPSLSSSTGRSMPARQYTPVAADRPGVGAAGAPPPRRRPPLGAAHRWCPRRRSADGCWGRLVPGPARCRARETRTTSVLLLPPSNASTAGSTAAGGHTPGCYVALRGDQRWPSSAGGAPTRRNWSTGSVIWRTGSSSTTSSCSIRATSGARSSGASPSASCGRGDGAGRSRRRPTRMRRSRGPTSSSSNSASAARRPATSTRRCPSATDAWARRRSGWAGWPRRCAPCRSCSSWPRRWRPGPIRVRGWSTSPTRWGS